jgi:hypothetical protein
MSTVAARLWSSAQAVELLLANLFEEAEGSNSHSPGRAWGDALLQKFFAPRAAYVRGERPEAQQEMRNLEARLKARSQRLQEKRKKNLDLAASSHRLDYDLRRAAFETTMALATPGELPVAPDAPSRCPKGGSLLIENENEVQMASRRLFQPNCDPRYRRVMVEMTPGIGKTCIYIGVIADFLGRTCKENEKPFDIIVLGDKDIFTRYSEDLRRCPARALLVEYFESSDGRLVRRQLLKHGTKDTTQDLPKGNGDGKVLLRDVNPRAASGFCAVATQISKGSKPHKTFEGVQNERNCGEDRLVWDGSRVIFMHYALAARWLVFSGQGVPAAEAAQHFDFATPEAREAFLRDAASLTWASRASPAAANLAQGEINKAKFEAGDSSSVYVLKDLALGMPHVVFIVDECQGLATPTAWVHSIRKAQKQGVFLSEALWRQTGDPKTSPYIFAGTGTPNIGPALTPSVCLLQMINGRSKPTSFLPFVLEDGGARVPVESVQEYRRLLRIEPAKPEDAPRFDWRKLSERTARHLVVDPRRFVDPEAGFVRDMSSSEAAFPLYLPILDASGGSAVVRGWRDNLGVYSYKRATEEVLKCLPAPPPPVAASSDDEAEIGHRSFICAARPSDLAAQASKIFKPVYEDHLNRLFLQDVVADRVFIANSYYDYHYYPQIAGASDPPLTRVVVPHDVLVCMRDAAAPSSRHRSKGRKDTLPARLQLQYDYPVAQLKTAEGERQQDPWSVPEGAAEHYVEQLRRGEGSKDLDWAERSLWAGDVAELQALTRKLVQAYWDDPLTASVELEDRLRDLVALNSPKLVAAADDMYPSSADAVQGKSFFFLNVQNHRDDDFRGLDDNHFLIVATFYLRMRCRPHLQRLHPDLEDAGLAQHRIGWLDALRRRPGQAPPEDFREEDKGAKPYWSSWIQEYRKLRTQGGAVLPAFFAIADNKLVDDNKKKDKASDAVHKRFLSYLAGESRSSPSFEDVLQLMGLPSLREAMVSAINAEPCLSRTGAEPWRLAPAGQSGLVGADASHRAINLKCVGFNLSFGPLPRGKRIQELGRNWRTCSFQELDDKELNWQIQLRQLMLAPPSARETHPEVVALLRRDLLLDSFYEAQSEALQWLRMITVSAGIGCSHWWEYSQWAKQFDTYHTRLPHKETEWFFDEPTGPCLDAPQLADGGGGTLFYRCSKTARGDAEAARGSVVASHVGSYYPTDIVGNSGDASCPEGSAAQHCRAFVAAPPPAPRPFVDTKQLGVFYRRR